MPANTYVALATQTLGTATASVTFSSIPSGYTDLVLVIGSLGMNATGSAGKLRFNGDTATNYSNTVLYGTGSTAGSYRESNQTNIRIYGAAVGPVANGNNDNVILHIQNYSNTTTNKTVIIRNNLPASETVAGVGLWRSTAAITSINIASYNGTDLFTVGSTFSLYGVAAASVGAKATGGTIYSDANYFYHVFAGNGTFTPSQALSADVLLLAGGGAGSVNVGGGGGAGGLRVLTSQSLGSGTAYTCTVGAGGAKASYPTRGSNGADSSMSGSGFTTITATGGGAGAVGSILSSGANGGSGGGGAQASLPGSGNTPSTSPSQGNNGGGSGSGQGHGGGGAGAVGGTGSGSVSGSGGVGSTTYATWSQATGFGELVSGTYYLAGGGGGGGGTASNYTPGAGGYGGGGLGGSLADAINAPANLGGGGGAGGVNLANTVGYAAGNGGSGLVIVRYAK